MVGFARKSDAFGVLVFIFLKTRLIQSEQFVKRFVSSTFSVRSILPEKPLNACFY